MKKLLLDYSAEKGLVAFDSLKSFWKK